MKRLLLIGAALSMLAPAFAQKANVKKVKSKVEYATKPMAYDFSNVEKEKVQELRELIEPAVTDPESKDMPDTWKYAIRLKVYDMNQLLAQYQANDNKFPDPEAFFKNQYDLVTYCETYNKLLNTPNEKGKLPLKEDEMKKEIQPIQTAAKSARTNLLIGATNLVYTKPQEAVKMLDLYYETLDNPLFDGLNLRETDKNLPVGYYTYAVALKSTGGDEQKYVDYLLKALDSDNGALACQDLMTYYKEKGDKANEQKYLAMGVEKFPGQIIFAVNYIQNLIVSKDYTKAVEAADKTIGNIESGVIPATNQNGEKVDANKWPYYFKAVALYNLDKLEDAYNAFVKAYEIEANFDNLSGAANCAANLAQRNNKDKALANKWYDKAIELYEQCRTDYPDKDDVWGIQLYVCYNNKASLNNSQEMLKKAKPFEKYKTK